ncbi:MAG TPA: hypothetical protein DDW36_00595 [Candidatus Magasanikbacteria bacterium]|nr:hypothetical protein [Candidatus Magasanikbacteria bacterium]
MPPRNRPEEEFEEQQTAQETQNTGYDPEVGEVLMRWEFPEYQHGHRGKMWYIIASLLAVILLLYAVWSENFTFAFLILLLALVYFMLEHRAPESIVCAITDVGVAVGNKFYRYRDMDAFWIIYYPPEIKNVYFHFPGGQGPRFRIPLEDIDPVVVRELLLAFLNEDLTQEVIPLSESFGRIFKL